MPQLEEEWKECVVEGKESWKRSGMMRGYGRQDREIQRTIEQTPIPTVSFKGVCIIAVC